MGVRIRVGVAGFRGYSGAELVRILDRHPSVETVLLEHRAEVPARPQPLQAKTPIAIPCTPEAIRTEGVALAFLATPPEVSMELAPALLDAGAKVIDLSGAFRFEDAKAYSRWYKESHTAAHLLKEAVYGLPEVFRSTIAGARLVANPGCYPTAANLAIQPLVEAGAVDLRTGVVCDAKSGVSGAGRKASLKTSYCEVTENFSVYSVLDHRHVPEVLRVSGLKEADFSFTAQLLPLDRGILETIYIRTRGIETAQAILDIYLRRYKAEPFVRLYKANEFPDLKAVQRTNFCDIGFKFDPATGRAVIVSAIDNLGKGAAGQAVQNMNLVLGFPETEALL